MIIVKNGHITLMGEVDSESDKTMAEMKARGVPGAFDVENELTVEVRTTVDRPTETVRGSPALGIDPGRVRRCSELRPRAKSTSPQEGENEWQLARPRRKNNRTQQRHGEQPLRRASAGDQSTPRGSVIGSRHLKSG